MEQEDCEKLDELKLVRQHKVKRTDIIKRTCTPAKILTLTFPQKLVETKTNKRKFKVLVLYEDDQGKKRRRVVKFGSYKQNDLSDQSKSKIPKKKIEKLKNSDTVLQSNYWRKNLLNKSEDLYSNFIDIIKCNNC